MEDDTRVLHSSDINVNLSTALADTIMEAVDGIPMMLSLSVLNGLVVAITAYVDALKEQAIPSEEDGIEKLVLSWMSAIDIKTRNNFSKYISTDCIDIDLDSLLHGEEG